MLQYVVFQTQAEDTSYAKSRHRIPLELDDHPIHDRRGDDVLPEPLLLQQL